ncbi:MAG TPA: type ISP restriction/modification enzyme [Ktedonobacteraceae bacterium]
MVRRLAADDGWDKLVARRPRALAARLAAVARRLRKLALAELEEGGARELVALYRQAQTDVAPELARDDFADLLAQVLVYSCLLARCSSQERGEPFALALRALLALPDLPSFAYHALLTLFSQGPDTSGVPDEYFFQTRAEHERETLVGSVRELAAFLISTDIQALLEKLRPACLQSNPLIYFYEIFLTEYAPDQRSQRGVYYTPAPVIAYMVRAIDDLLRSAFAYPTGLAGALQDERQDGGVFLCDPACGTGAFLWAVLDYVHQLFPADRRDHLARALLTGERGIPACLAGYEVMPAAAILAGIEQATRLSALVTSTHERVVPQRASPAVGCSCITLVNVLADARPLAQLSAGALPIILGNPPYAGHSLNHSPWLGQLLESYKAGDAGLRKPAQAKWLSDDYVQFLRLAQWLVEQAGRGIVAFLTSHSYLDNLTFRGMRLSLLRAFDEIYILDLHGNSKRREQAPGGTRDRNIFAIQQGVAIGLFVKRSKSQSLASVHHADVWGQRAVYEVSEDGARQLSGGKLGWLASHALQSTPWQTGQPVAPFYLFTPRNNKHHSEYMAWWGLPAIFAQNGDPAPGLVTCHDEFAISWNAEEVEAKIAALLAASGEAEARGLFRLCAQKQWNYAAARQALSTDAWREHMGLVTYRPFDTRWTVFERHVAVHLRERVTRHMRAGPNLALAVGRAGQVIEGGDTWDVAFCSRLPTEFNLYRRGGNYLFPLYLYPTAGAGTTRRANLDPRFITESSQRLALSWLPDGPGDLRATFGPDDLFAYLYALLYSPAYRARYADFLKIDFPRVPLPARVELFRALCPLGRALSQAHLQEQPLPTATSWLGAGDYRVEHARYLADPRYDGRVIINATQALAGVPPRVWALTIGGYQVARKWLLDRRGHPLNEIERNHYRQIIASLARTLELMAAIDRVIEQHDGWPL